MLAQDAGGVSADLDLTGHESGTVTINAVLSDVSIVIPEGATVEVTQFGSTVERMVVRQVHNVHAGLGKHLGCFIQLAVGDQLIRLGQRIQLHVLVDALGRGIGAASDGAAGSPCPAGGPTTDTDPTTGEAR